MSLGNRMHVYFVAAAIVAVVVGIIHSVLGEILSFRKLRKTGLVPKEPAPPLQGRNVRILWTTWHLASAFGFGFSGILLSLAGRDSPPPTLQSSMRYCSHLLLVQYWFWLQQEANIQTGLVCLWRWRLPILEAQPNKRCEI